MGYIEKELENHPAGCTVMTFEDAERMRKRNEKDLWGFSESKLLHMLADHIEAANVRKYDEDPNHVMEAIRTQEMHEYRLEDANYHTFANLLNESKYVSALDWIKKEYMEVE